MNLRSEEAYRRSGVKSCAWVALLLLTLPALAASDQGWARNDLRQAARLVARHYDVPVSLVYALIQVESDWKPGARSHKGALGLMQLMPTTANRLGVNPHDPAENLIGGVRLLRQLMERYPDRLDLALAAYNAGEPAVNRYAGVPPYPETQAYVHKVLTLYGTYQNPVSVRAVHRIRDEGAM